jgi:DNA modification methylase
VPEPYYQDDVVTIYHGDALELADIVAKAQVMVTDPPYGIAYVSNQIGKFKGRDIAGDDNTAARDAILSVWEGPAAVFGSWKMPRPAGVKAILTWDKGEGVGMGDLSLPWRPNTEEIYILGEGWRGHRGSSVIRDTSVVSWTGNGRGPRRLHPTEKPVPLLQQIIAKAPDHPVVVDPFMGSGTTLRAAKNLGRRAIGIEVREDYCQVAAERCAQDVLFGEAA